MTDDGFQRRMTSNDVKQMIGSVLFPASQNLATGFLMIFDS